MSNAVVHADSHGDAHAAHHPALQHHFDTMGQQKEAAVIGMWVFLLTEILFFGGLFMAYMLYRIWYHDAFVEASKTLDLRWGALNTVVLIASSLTMAMAVRSAQTDQRKALVRWLIATMFLGAIIFGKVSSAYGPIPSRSRRSAINLRFRLPSSVSARATVSAWTRALMRWANSR